MKHRKLLTAAVCAALTTVIVPKAQAQSVDPAAAAADDAQVKELGTVTVTGSRISNPNVVSPAPISILTAEDIKATGAVNIGDLLTTMPQLATTFTMGNSGRFIGTAGVAMQDLRNLGTARTLVLVNGRRMVASSSGSSAVDTNLIPTDWVDRVEIITGGASAVYGADAVSGVVNFILKKSYEGLALRAQYGDSQHGGFDEKFLSVTGGKNFAEDRGNFAVSLEHSRQNALQFRDRFGRQVYSTINTPGGPTDSVLMPDAGSFRITDGGTFTTTTQTDLANRYVFDPGGSFRNQRFDGVMDTARCSDCDHIDGNRTLQLQPKYDRTTLSSVAGFDLTQDHRLYFEGTYSLVDVKSYFSPAFGSATTGNAHLIQSDNAYISPELAAVTGNSDFRVSRNDVDAGRRGEATERQTGRVVFGIEGVVTEDWLYDASVNYGRTHERRENLNNRVLERFYAGLDAVRDPATGQIVCRSQIDPTAVNEAYFLNSLSPDGIISPEVAASCIPFSVFGDGAISTAASSRFNTTTITKTRLTQFVAGGSLTNNNLFDLPAGPMSLGMGVEYRRETSHQDNDPLDVSGQTFLNAIPSSGGSYNVKEVWAEVAVPILSDLVMVKSLAVGAAARYSQYDTIGSTEAWRYNLDWAVNDSLRIRGNMSAAVRAPNIDELFSGQSQNFFAITDPCDSRQLDNAADPAVRRANCAALGIPPGFEDEVTGTNEGLSGSNPNLDPETGRSWTAGFVFTPTFLPGFGLNADYWEIKIEDAITAPSGQQTADRCVDSVSGIGNVFCGNITRDPLTGQITFVRSINENIAATETDGVDIGVYYNFDLVGGKMRWNLNATKVLGYTDFPFQDSPDESEDQNKTLGFPEWKATLGVMYGRDSWDVSWNSRYVSDGLRVTNASFKANPTSTTPIKAGSGVFHDVRGAYRFGEGWEVYAGVTNLFDSDPPVNLFGTGFGSALYDAIGRAYYVGANYKF
ncbi:TonB-dependent receptor domain-containing protein [Lysobacter cavernae]|uniref:TonB-dependent receptor domain-containing protein n=1 Tax=Lysobacter cavernae TaxID=1685901 RepID=A0ABV7RQ69_9GAMM